MSDLTHPALREFSAAAETVEEYPEASFCHTGVDTADVPKVTPPAKVTEFCHHTPLTLEARFAVQQPHLHWLTQGGQVGAVASAF